MEIGGLAGTPQLWCKVLQRVQLLLLCIDMEFLVEVSRHKLKSYQTRVFVWFSKIIFLFYKMLFMNRLEFSGFVDFS